MIIVSCRTALDIVWLCHIVVAVCSKLTVIFYSKFCQYTKKILYLESTQHSTTLNFVRKQKINQHTHERLGASLPTEQSSSPVSQPVEPTLLVLVLVLNKG